MDSRHARAIVAHAAALAGAHPAAVPDADLLKRFVQDRDEAAFAELVRRYGRLVWAVCRHLLPSDADADDAFQATFLVLVRSPGGVRDGTRLGPWLHGVAYRVCLKSKRSVARRKRREVLAAKPEAGRPLPDSAWDEALRAVHEEVDRLPTSLRVPFVMCCLEGKGATEVAAQLGWKIGTLSGRLTRAKQTILARLSDRGIAAGAVAAVAITGGAASGGAPLTVVARTATLLQPDTIPSSILHLSQGVTEMSVHRMKLLAAAVLVTSGITIGVGSGWLSNVGAQTPEVRREVAELALGPLPPLEEGKPFGIKVRFEVADAPKWEFHYVPQRTDYGPKKSEFEAMLRDTEKDGWEFVGVVNMKWEGTLPGEPKGNGGVIVPTYVFKRPIKAKVYLGEKAAAEIEYSQATQAASLASYIQALKKYVELERAVKEDMQLDKSVERSKERSLELKQIEANLAKVGAELAKARAAAAALQPIDSRLIWIPLDPRANAHKYACFYRVFRVLSIVFDSILFG